MTETDEEKALPKRDQVLELLKDGNYTREEMATKLSMSVASVNSQFTYLRWMGNFIRYDENKKLSICTEAEFNEWEASKKTATKASTAKPKSPVEVYEAMKKTLATDIKNRDAWIAKAAAANKAAAGNEDDEDLMDAIDEAEAMVVLLALKVKRGQIKFDATPVPVVEPIVTPEALTEEPSEDVEVEDGIAADDDII